MLSATLVLGDSTQDTFEITTSPLPAGSTFDPGSITYIAAPTGTVAMVPSADGTTCQVTAAAAGACTITVAGTANGAPITGDSQVAVTVNTPVVFATGLHVAIGPVT